jgi:hypothetical protein
MLKENNILINFVFVLVFFGITGASSADERDDNLALLEKLVSDEYDLKFYFVNVTSNQCREIHIIEQDIGNITKFRTKGLDSTGYFGVGGRNGYRAFFPNAGRLLQSGTIADTAAMACAKVPEFREAVYSKTLKTESGEPYMWVFKNRNQFCSKMSILPNCEISCLQTVPQYSDVFGIALTKEVAEAAVGGKCIDK